MNRFAPSDANIGELMSLSWHCGGKQFASGHTSGHLMVWHADRHGDHGTVQTAALAGEERGEGGAERAPSWRGSDLMSCRVRWLSTASPDAGDHDPGCLLVMSSACPGGTSLPSAAARLSE